MEANHAKTSLWHYNMVSQALPLKKNEKIWKEIFSHQTIFRLIFENDWSWYVLLWVSRLPEVELFAFVISILISKSISIVWSLSIFCPEANFARIQIKWFNKVNTHYLKVKLNCAIMFKLVYKRLYQSKFDLSKYHRMCRIYFWFEIDAKFPASKRSSSNSF